MNATLPAHRQSDRTGNHLRGEVPPPRQRTLLAALQIIPKDEVEATVSLGELSLDGRLIPVIGALPAAMAAAEEDRALLCPRACGAEAAWVGATQVLAAGSLDEVVRHFTGQAPITPAEAGEVLASPLGRDMREVKGQERAKRALEIAAAGRHHGHGQRRPEAPAPCRHQ